MFQRVRHQVGVGAVCLFFIFGLARCGPVDESSTTTCHLTVSSGSTGSGIRQASGTNVAELAQSFQPTEDVSVSNVRVSLQRVGTITTGSTLRVSIYTDNGGEPSTTESAFGTMDAAEVATSVSNYTFTLSSTLALSKSTTYWIVIKALYTASDTNYVNWLGSTSNVYTSGQALVNQNTSGFNWQTNSTTVDMNFAIACS